MNNGVEVVPKGLKLRGKTWHISRQFNGKPVRVSTGCTDLANAIQVYRVIENRHTSGVLDEWWAEQVRIAGGAGAKKSWIMRALYRCRARANVESDLTKDDILTIATQCGGRCAVTGLRFSEARYGRRRPFVPSLDRIDCQKGYTLTNCRFVCLIANYAMSDFGEGAFSIMARAYAARQLTENIAKSLHTILD